MVEAIEELMEAIDEAGVPEFVAIHDVGTDIWLLDVSGCREAVGPGVLQEFGNPALVCFGGHDERSCAIDGAPGAADGHGVVLEVVSSRTADAAFARRFRRLIAAETPVHVLRRRVAVA